MTNSVDFQSKKIKRSPTHLSGCYDSIDIGKDLYNRGMVGDNKYDLWDAQQRNQSEAGLQRFPNLTKKS